MVYFQMIGSRKKVVKCELSQLYVQSKNNIFTRREEARREYLPIQTEIEKPFSQKHYKRLRNAAQKRSEQYIKSDFVLF